MTATALAFDLLRRIPGGPTIRAALEHAPEDGLVTVLFGPSGSGKTTVLRCLAGLDRPDEGFIRCGGETWFDARSRRFEPVQQRRVGLLFQDYALFPHLSVEENIGYGLARLDRRERAERVLSVSRLLRIEEYLGRRPGQLSGGQRQRVALARALAPAPQLLLLDEPFSALDAPTREELRGEVRSLLLRAQVPSIVVTHDRVEALALGDRMAVLAAGAVRQGGRGGDVFSAPADLVVAKVVGTENVAPARILGREDGLAVVEVGSAKLLAVDPGPWEGEAFACIRAEEIVLERTPDAVTSARNQLLGTVQAVIPEGALVRVILDCGFRLVALVTRQSIERLGLAQGSAAAALIKAPAIRLVPHAAAPQAVLQRPPVDGRASARASGRPPALRSSRLPGPKPESASRGADLE
jgi:molybdate transport system ATP-binding protein